jgi:tRNA(fMet)-specific endonuclease VapC
MSFLLDTDVCSAHFRRPSGFSHRFIQHSGRLFVSSVVLGELYAGAFHYPDPAPLLDRIAELLQDLPVIPFDEVCARRFGLVRGNLLKQGISVPSADLMIAATALSHDLILVTHNTADYRYARLAS